MDSQIKTERSWFGVVFGAFFALPALLMFIKMLGAPIYDVSRMQFWESTNAKLHHTEVKYYQGDSTTYQAVADYTYEVNGRYYEGDRVSVHGGSDNVGGYHQKMGQQLRRSGNELTVYYDPENPSDSIIDRSLRWELLGVGSIFVIIFGLVGGGIMYFSWRGKRRIVTPESTDKPWLSNPDWAENKIKCNVKIEMYGLIIFSVIWNVMTWPALIFQGKKIYEEAEPWVLIFGLFPFIGLYLIYLAMKSVKQNRVFGKTLLTLTPFPGSIGGQVGGKINLPRNTSSLATYKVKVVCIKKYFTTGSGNKRTLKERLKWEGETFGNHFTREGVDGLEFCLDIPEGLPETQLDEDESWHEWRAEVVSEDIDLKRSFVIPVYQTKQKSTINYVVPQQLLTQKAHNDLANALPVQEMDDEIRVHYPMFYKPKTKIIIIVVGLGILGLFNVLSDEVPSFLYWVFTFIGALMLFFSLKSLLSTLTVVVTERTLSVTNSLLGIFKKKQEVAFSEIESLQKKEEMRSQSGSNHTVHYSIRALLSSGQKLKLTRYIDGDSAADEAKRYFSEKLGFAT